MGQLINKQNLAFLLYNLGDAISSNYTYSVRHKIYYQLYESTTTAILNYLTAPLGACLLRFDFHFIQKHL